MGQPAKLIDVARLMIRLSGKKEKLKGEKTEGIEIEEVGLRPGEKLFEELLIGDNVAGTSHPKIMMAMDTPPSSSKLRNLLEKVEECMKKDDVDTLMSLLQKWASLSNVSEPEKTPILTQHIDVDPSGPLH